MFIYIEVDFFDLVGYVIIVIGVIGGIGFEIVKQFVLCNVCVYFSGWFIEKIQQIILRLNSDVGWNFDFYVF